MEYSGLSSTEAQTILETSGANEIPEPKGRVFKKILGWFITPIALMLLLAAFLSLYLHRIFDFYLIIALWIMNSLIGFWQENKADNAIKKLNQKLISQVKVKRDGNWQLIDSRLIVKGDLIEINVGDITSADGLVIESSNLSLNEAAVTGESLPKDKKAGDTIYSGTIVSTGKGTVKITAVGKSTFFGKTLLSVDSSRKKSTLEKDILTISRFLSILSLSGVVILSAVFILQKVNLLDLVTLDLSLVIAGIPVSLPTVMTLIIEFGVIELSKKQVIVRRLSALEDLANVNLLLTDKTGTLTKNEIRVNQVVNYSQLDNNELLKLALLSVDDARGSINQAIENQAKSLGITTSPYRVLNYIPADSVRKRSTTMISGNGQEGVVSLGAPQVIAGLCRLSRAEKERMDNDVSKLAYEGFRCLALAQKSGGGENDMSLLGLLTLSDTLREDARDVIAFMGQNGIKVVMLTGDNKEIGRQVAKVLGLGEAIINKDELSRMSPEEINKKIFETTGVFSEILPDDKYKLVKAAKNYFVVAVTGDGVNDLPAVKEANVGMAVKSAVDALKATADIVLLSDGISVIKDAILESRKIFARLYSYSTYRISESLRLIVTITVLGLIYRLYPLTPVQLILLALLNDIPIISLAFDRVKIALQPTKINVRERFTLSSLFGLAGILNSLILFFLMTSVFHLNWGVIQTVYFLKLTVSGHMLIYVARTKERWWRFLPSKQVIIATTLTQLVATTLALTGLVMPSKIPFVWVIVVWVWSFFWMQISELLKFLRTPRN